MAPAGVGHEEKAPVAREGEAIGLHAVGHHRRHLARHWIDAVDVGGADLALRGIALVIAVDAVGRIGEPEGAVLRLRHVVGRVQAPALPVARQHGARAVMLDAADDAGLVLAGDQSALAVGRVAVVVAAALPEDGDGPVGLVVAHQPVVGDVGPDKILAGGEIGRPLAPARAGPELLQLRVADDHAPEARIQDGDVARCHGHVLLPGCAGSGLPLAP